MPTCCVLGQGTLSSLPTGGWGGVGLDVCIVVCFNVAILALIKLLPANCIVSVHIRCV